MVISDLQYLESVETASIVGGGRKTKKGKGGFGDINVNVIYVEQYNFAIFSKNVKQENDLDIRL
jgi:hypothetical protein